MRLPKPMAVQTSKIDRLKAWIQTALEVFDSDLVELVMRVWQLAKQLMPGPKKAAPLGSYEVLAYESRLELKDAKGKKAIFYKREHVRFLQNNVIAFQDLVWGDGDIFVDYKCSPGVAVDRYREGHRYRVLISLRETKNQGDEEEFLIQRTIRDGFVKNVESFQTEVNHPTRTLTVSVVFPRARLPQRVSLTQQNMAHTVELGPENRLKLPDGRTQFSWKTSAPQLYEAYILRWEW